MPITLEELKIVIELAERGDEDLKSANLGDMLSEIGRKVKGAKPEEDIRKFREDEDVFS